MSNPLRITPLGPHIGAEISGIQLAEPLSDSHFGQIHQALLSHQVLFFRDQPITPLAQRALANRFGDLHIHPIYPHAPEAEEIIVLDTHNGNPPDNDNWHTDVTFIETPPALAILAAKQLPPVGGDTLWASGIAAFEGLSPRLQQLLAGLEAEHDFSKSFPAHRHTGSPEEYGRWQEAVSRHPPLRHPVIRTHPLSGRQALFVNEGFTTRLLDLPEHKVQLRLGSTALQAKNVRLADGKLAVDVTYIKEGKLHRVRAKQSVMAGYNMMIPYMVPEMPEPQKEALRQNVKAPLVYTKVVIKNWQAFVKLGVHEVYSPAAPYSRVKLDYPVSMGGYEHPKSPDQPMCLHMVYVPTLPGSGLSAREQSRKGRAMILGMPFEQHEQMIREQLQGMLGSAGFNHEQDILAITVNRWSHGYSYVTNTLFDDEAQCEKWIELGRQPIGNITIANSDAGWSPYAHAAIDEAWRAVNELVAMSKGGAQ